MIQNNWHPADGMMRDVDYELSEEELARSRSLTPYQRLKWLDDARRFILLARATARLSQEKSQSDDAVEKQVT
ncbi:MAG: hypothetical protein V1746_05365 [bacterium]